MKTFSCFKRDLNESLYGSPVTEERISGNHRLIQSKNGVFIDSRLTSFSSIPEAILSLENDKLLERLIQEGYNRISDEKIASIIAEHNDIRITNTLIEQYRDKVASKSLSLDPVILELRKFNQASLALSNKIDFTLEDGSRVAVSEETYNQLRNKYSGDDNQLKESLDIFKSAVRKLLEPR